MNWDEFFIAAYLKEQEKSGLYKANRWLGLRFSYIFYYLRFSTNILSKALV